jgi:hypothetical protein
MPCWKASQQCLAGRRLSGLGTRCHYSLGAIGGMLGRLTPGGPSNPCDCPRDRRLPGGSDFGKQSRVRLRSYVPRRRATDRKLVRTQENGQVFLQQLTLLATRLTASEWCYRRLDAAIRRRNAPRRASGPLSGQSGVLSCAGQRRLSDQMLQMRNRYTGVPRMCSSSARGDRGWCELQTDIQAASNQRERGSLTAPTHPVGV